MMPTANRAELVNAIVAPYQKLEKYFDHRDGPSAAWALVVGGAEFVADALLANPDSAYWRCEKPLETGGDGAALRWLREHLDADSGADERFLAYARTPGCEVPRKTADITRWFFESRYTAADAIAYASSDGDYPIHEDFAPYVRERLICGLPVHARDAARKLANNYSD